MIGKAQIVRLNAAFQPVGPACEVQFNPTEFTLNKGVQLAEAGIPGLDTPIIQFVRGQTETLSLELFFDTTDDSSGPGPPLAVTTKTDPFYQLIKIDPRTHAPPICRFVWGPIGGDGSPSFPGSGFTGPWTSQRRGAGFQCVVESVRQRFTLFHESGVPLRATVSVSLKEYMPLDSQVASIPWESADRTHVELVSEGGSLASMADEAYGDPGAWRRIAAHNQIDDPSALAPGAALEVPPEA
jgi:Contractile injection system tube protein